MKLNVKANILWIFLLLLGYGMISLLVSLGILNLFHIQILEQIGINIILAVGLNLIVGFSGQFHSDMLDLWLLVLMLQLLSVQNLQLMVLSLELCCSVLLLLVWLPSS